MTDTTMTAWPRVHVVVAGDDADAAADVLFAAGALAIDATDADADTPDESPRFGEPGSTAEPAWPRTRLTALFDVGTEAPLGTVQSALHAAGIDADDPTVDGVPEQDWVRLTQQQYAPIAIGPRLWIVPTWCEPPHPDAIVLRLDPGLAFGTGSHPTTRLCLRWLDAHLRVGETVLDYGCGSGVLAIAAAKLGAGPVTGLDIDPQALVATRTNAERNGVTVAVLDADAAQVPVCDVVVANILSNPLRALAPLLCHRVRRGGRLVLSGILEAQADDIAAYYSPWIDVARPEIEDGWACVWGTRRL